jgi:hypothetical protein
MVQRSARGDRGDSICDLRIMSASATWIMVIFCMSAPASCLPDLRTSAGGFYTTLHSPVISVQAKQNRSNFKVRDVSGPAGQPIPITIETADVPGEDGRQLFIFSGIPNGVTLSPGGDLGDFWAVNSSVIKSLTLTAPDGFSGTFTVRITQSGTNASSGGAVAMRVVIGQDRATSATAAISDLAPNPSYQAPPSPSAPLANQDMLMARGKALFQQGDVAGARMIYDYLARQGSSAAAIAMGETFDPAILSGVVVKGLASDVAKARQWYEKAEELGSREARRRLNAMMTR